MMLFLAYLLWHLVWWFGLCACSFPIRKVQSNPRFTKWSIEYSGHFNNWFFKRQMNLSLHYFRRKKTEKQNARNISIVNQLTNPSFLTMMTLSPYDLSFEESWFKQTNFNANQKNKNAVLLSFQLNDSSSISQNHTLCHNNISFIFGGNSMKFKSGSLLVILSVVLVVSWASQDAAVVSRLLIKRNKKKPIMP